MGVDQSEDSLKTLRSSYMFYAYSGLIYVFVFIFDPAIQAAFREVKWSIGFSFGNVAKRLCFWKKERIFADLDDNCDFTPAVPDNRLTDIDQVINLYEVLSNEPQMDSTFLLRARKMQNNLNEEYLSDSFKTKGPTFSFL
ncbi:hypothetical protein AX774_g6505 [Zancudomyces culisetae]|uniref:Uncharacterized protein n=1 Tax=Zancudomyces culisetae TaxID=1213189 RepID=A0A1R1PGM4_ZANCU|nr:hypothetical protein AX774_g6505 [Zancudomyces culisetae]|eukprot:OMH80063.1 hypothetical protein AX774_g6505 [Zancudomyces culisetae]